MSGFDWDIFHIGSEDPRQHYRGDTHYRDFDYSDKSEHEHFNGNKWTDDD